MTHGAQDTTIAWKQKRRNRPSRQHAGCRTLSAAASCSSCSWLRLPLIISCLHSRMLCTLLLGCSSVRNSKKQWLSCSDSTTDT